MSEVDLPILNEAINLYERTYTGHLTNEHPFGEDPLRDSEELMEERATQFDQNFVVADIFGDCVNNRAQLLQNAVLFFIDKTIELSHQL